MIVNFAQVLRALDPNAMLRVMAESRNDPDYFLTTLLPERPMPSYSVEAGNITIRATMAGLVGMDAPYPEGGAIDVGTFLEKSAKIAARFSMREEVIRTLQATVQQFALMGRDGAVIDPEDFLTDEALNFFDKVVVQAVKDTREWLRGQALTGTIDWTFNNKRLLVDYGFPVANILTERTGEDRYGGTTSKFWDDVRTQNRLLRKSTRIVRLAHPDTIDEIVYNPVNAGAVVAETEASVTVQRVNPSNNNLPVLDTRDRVTLIKYGLEGEVLDPTDSSLTQALPFVEIGQLHAIGSGNNRAYRVGEGSAENPRNELELGYTHLAPTVEGSGAMGDWGRIYTPEERQWELHGESVSNCLPVVEGNERVVNGQTAMAA